METIQFSYTEGDFSRLTIMGIAVRLALMIGCAATFVILSRGRKK